MAPNPYFQLACKDIYGFRPPPSHQLTFTTLGDCMKTGLPVTLRGNEINDPHLFVLSGKKHVKHAPAVF